LQSIHPQFLTHWHCFLPLGIVPTAPGSNLFVRQLKFSAPFHLVSEQIENVPWHGAPAIRCARGMMMGGIKSIANQSAAIVIEDAVVLSIWVAVFQLSLYQISRIMLS
jgi:hypothetical protein